MTPLVCPLGHRFEIPDVVYGDPTPEAMYAAARDEITLGGCMPDMPVARPCPTCGLTAYAEPEWASQWASGEATDPADGPA